MARVTVRKKRVYDEVEGADGFRVLVDRLWPRGLTKAAASIDLWAKGVAPSNELRKWYHEDRSRFQAFQARHRAELEGANDEVEGLLVAFRASGESVLTLLTSAKDVAGSHVPVIVKVVEERL